MTTIHVVVRLVHFAGGGVNSEVISFHQTEKEAASAKASEVERLQRKFAVHGNKALLAQIGVAGVSFEIGAFETSHENLVKVPSIILPH